jgi:hypothetical protein
MTVLLGILGAGVLFTLLGYSATRIGSRLEEAGGCHSEACGPDSCAFHDGCDLAEKKSLEGWWTEEPATYGDRR